MAPLSRERWQAVSPLLDRALEIAPAEREAWIATLRADDPTLAADVQELLQDHAAASREGFLEDPPTVAPPPTSLAGQRLGPYALVSPIGQGGMGSVWLARRSDGRFEGQAAVKLLRLSLVGRGGGERFQREGNILARLRHPHIAHLIDAGLSSAGQPYLVLEHVDGQPIDAYCNAAGLGVEARIRLFLDVAEAVAHAHANLIVHRDLKPSNVLVSFEGRVKLLDFGIAKLLEAEMPGGEPSPLTREGGAALTPEYAAPEQVTGGPITTATDIYALGVLLYLLLAGRHPAGDARQAPADLLKAIVETEPLRLSDAAQDNRLRRLLRGDLDTIVAKALKKDARERYASVAALADDLRRYLDHKPISARPDTLAYRTAKFVRRHRTPMALAALAFLALLGGLAGTITQARRATREAALALAQRRQADEQRDFALRQLSRAEAINDLNAFVLSDAAPSGRPFSAGDLLAAAERVVDRQQADTDENRVEMLVSIGGLYQIRDEQAKARALLSKAYELSLKVSDRSVRANAACSLAAPIAFAGEFQRAEKLVRGALEELGDAPQFALQRVSCLMRWSKIAAEGGDAEGALDHVLAAQRLLHESRQGSSLREVAVSMDLAEAYRMAGRNREAASEFDASFTRLATLGRDETERAGSLLNNWGLTVQLLGQPLEAERLFRRAMAIGSADGTEKSVSPMLLNNLARVLLELHRLPEAAGYAERAYAEARQAGDEIVVNQALSVRFNIYLEQRQRERAAAVLAELEPRWKKMMPPGHIAFALTHLYEALLAAGRGERQTAVAEAEQAVSMAEASSQAGYYVRLFLLRRAEIGLDVGRPDLARADAERLIALERKAVGPGALASTLGRGYLLQGRALLAQGKVAEAQGALALALDHLQPTLGKDHPLTRLARQLGGSAVPRL